MLGAAIQLFDALRTVESNYRKVLLEAAHAAEEANQWKWAKEQIQAKFTVQVGSAEASMALLREEVGTLTQELWQALQAAKTTHAEAEAKTVAAEGRAAEMRQWAEAEAANRQVVEAAHTAAAEEGAALRAEHAVAKAELAAAEAAVGDARGEHRQLQHGQAELERQRGRQDAAVAGMRVEFAAARAEAEGHRSRRAAAEQELGRLKGRASRERAEAAAELAEQQRVNGQVSREEAHVPNHTPRPGPIVDFF
eukprot:SAG22_NODE_837_length_6911_cov_4.576629_2_plen_252_part_00